MVLNNLVRPALACALLLSLAACSVVLPRESPLNEVTKDSPTVLDVYRGHTAAGSSAVQAREALSTDSKARPVVSTDAQKSKYWNPLEPTRSRFARVPNPDLVMVVFPHLAKGKYPVPGYVTTFPMYEQTYYALPGEVESELQEAKALYKPQPPAAPKTPAPVVTDRQ